MYSRTNKHKRGIGASSQSNSKQHGIRNPHNHDVLCGRGGGSKNHEGNINFRQIIEINRKLYESCSKERKRLLARSIVDTFQTAQNPPGKFLQKGEDGLWYELRYEAAVEKTKQSLREARGGQAKNRKIKKRTSDESQLPALVSVDSNKRQKTDGRDCNIIAAGEVTKPLVLDKDLIPENDHENEVATCTKQTRNLSQQSGHITTKEVDAGIASCNTALQTPPASCDEKPETEPTLPALARISSTLGTLMRQGPFLPLMPFDDETEKRILGEYDVDSDSSRSMPQHALPIFKDQITLSLSPEDTELLCQVSSVFSAAFCKGRNGEQSGTKSSHGPKAPMPSSAPRDALSPEETKFLSRISTLSLATFCQSEPVEGGSGANVLAPDMPRRSSRVSFALSPEETRLLSQMTSLLSASGNDDAACRPTKNDHAVSVGLLSLADLLAGATEEDGSERQAAASLLANDLASLTAGQSMSAALAAAIGAPPEPCSAQGRSCSDDSLLEDDDLDTAAVARLRDMSCP